VIFNKGLILPPPLNYLHFEDLQHDDDADDDEDDDEDGLPVVVAVPDKAQAFAVYIYILSIPKMSTIFNNEISKSRIFQVVTFRDLHYRFSSP
jgi:hypothetical protein